MASARRFNRGLSDEFVTEFRTGRFAPLLAAALKSDLDVQIREKYVNFYCGGRRVLHLEELRTPGRYRAEIAGTYLKKVELPDAMSSQDPLRFDATESFATAYVQHLPTIVDNAQRHAEKIGRREEIVEREMIRAGLRDGSPVVFIDRQVQVHGIRKGADLVGLTTGGQFAIVEVKQGLDNRIQRLMEQIHGYYKVLTGPDKHLHPEVAESYGRVIEQKQALGLLQQGVQAPSAQTPVTCLLVLYNYNPHSKLLGRLREERAAYSLPVDLVQLPEGTYALSPAAEWERLCPAQ